MFSQGDWPDDSDNDILIDYHFKIMKKFKFYFIHLTRSLSID